MKTTLRQAFGVCLLFFTGLISICAQDYARDTSFNPTFNNRIYDVVVQPDQKIVVIGQFSMVNGVTRHSGSVDSTLMSTVPVNPGDKPVYGDFNKDGTADVGISNNGVWSPAITNVEHSASVTTTFWGLPGYYLAITMVTDERTLQYFGLRMACGTSTAVAMDITLFSSVWMATYLSSVITMATGKSDIGVYRNGIWFLLKSTEGFGGEYFRLAGDIPIPGQLN